MIMSFLQQNQSQGQNETCLKLRRGWGKGRGGGLGGEMTQKVYAHLNKRTTTKKMFIH
jgi:hypothetical protein